MRCASSLARQLCHVGPRSPRTALLVVTFCTGAFREAKALASMASPGEATPYQPPSWARDRILSAPEHGRLCLANLPTPLYPLRPRKNNGIKSTDNTSVLEMLSRLDITLFVKRDDMTGGVELGGNKIRKLEFLLADALAGGYNSVVTIGGEQSNIPLPCHSCCRPHDWAHSTSYSENETRRQGAQGRKGRFWCRWKRSLRPHGWKHRVHLHSRRIRTCGIGCIGQTRL